MVHRVSWTRQELLVAFALYCRLPFGRLHHRNPEIIAMANAIGRTPSALAMKLTNIASLDPSITTTGRKGLRSASAADRAMWAEMNNDWDRFAIETEKAISDVMHSTTLVMDDSREDYFADERIGANRVVQTTARVGQNFFRSAVLSAYNGCCCITGLSIPSLLVASHIVPWRDNLAQGLNPRNGLALSVLHDKAFDTGIITVQEDLTVSVSRNLEWQDDDFFASSVAAYDGQPICRPGKFAPDPEFLAYHREHVFQG